MSSDLDALLADTLTPIIASFEMLTWLYFRWIAFFTFDFPKFYVIPLIQVVMI